MSPQCGMLLDCVMQLCCQQGPGPWYFFRRLGSSCLPATHVLSESVQKPHSSVVTTKPGLAKPHRTVPAAQLLDVPHGRPCLAAVHAGPVTLSTEFQQAVNSNAIKQAWILGRLRNYLG